MNKSIKIDINKKDFKSVYEVSKIDIDKTTFNKFNLNEPVVDMLDSTKQIFNIGNFIGEEIHICKPEVIVELAGQVGLIIKGFEVVLVGKSRKKVYVNKIVRIEE